MRETDCGVRVLRLLLLAVSMWCGQTLRAGTTDGALRVEMITAYNFVVDSNAGTPSSYAPRSAYLGATFHNDGSVPLTDILARIGDYQGGAGDTPGLYPARIHDGLVGPLPGGAFALKHEGGSAGLADATRYIGSIAPGESVTVYWLVSYPQLDVTGVPTWGASVKPDDDLWLQYDVWATAKEGAQPRAVDLTRTVTMRNEISASANKILPNGSNKVPDYYKDLLRQYLPAWTNSVADGSVGTRVTTEGIWYYLGHVGDGFDNNGDLVPEHNAWLQPVGDPSLFDAGAFRLVRTYAMVIVKLKSGGEQVLVGEDQLYFENIPENTDAVGYVRYDFVPILSGARSVLTPYQEVASGSDNEKFNADFGAALGDNLVSSESHARIDKTASVADVLPGGAITYTLTFTNDSLVAVGNPAFGVPLVVQDAVPAGTAYVAGSATNSLALPPGVSSLQVLYSADGGTTWSVSEPSPASSVTHLQWWLSDPLPALSVGAVSFTVQVDSPFSSASPAVENVGGLSFGGGAAFATDSTSTRIRGYNTLDGGVFADIGGGAGGYYANGLQDGGEGGLFGISVDLYVDSDGDGCADPGEPLVAITTTDSTGDYRFSGLPDGRYVAVVSTHDATLPSGYALTTPACRAVALDVAGGTPGGVAGTAARFGFAPALSVAKGRIGSGPLREGQEVTYLLAVTNRLAGDGSGTSTLATYTTWGSALDTARSGTGNKAWAPTANVYSPASLDGQYATALYENAGEKVAVTAFSLGPQLGSITNVRVVAQLQVLGTFRTSPQQETLTVRVFTVATGAVIAEQTFNCPALSSGLLSVDVTSARAWQWSDFSGSTYGIQLEATGAGGSYNGTVGADAIGFRVTANQSVGGASDETTLSPVPLADRYDAARLRFVSANVPPDSVSATGAGELLWNDLGPIYAGGGRSVSVTFTVLEPPGNVEASVTNVADVTRAFFANGRPANMGSATNVATVLPAGSLGDRVWRDLDGDGAQDAGEPGVPGVTVRLTPPLGVDLGAGTNQPVSTVTDADGFYRFAGLPATGTYTVSVVTATLPGATGTPSYDLDGIATPHTAAVYVNHAAGGGADSLSAADFGYRLQTTVRGTLWHDVDRDGGAAPEAGEDLLAGVTVRLFSTNGVTVVGTTTTSATGTYLFSGVAAGSYLVRADTSTGPLGAGSWTASYDSDGVGSVSEVAVTVLANGQGVADFSYVPQGARSLGGRLFYDWDGDGVQDALVDEGVEGVVVRLYQDENTNGVVDVATDALVAVGSTASDGSYLFQALPTGSYQIVVDENASTHVQLYSYTRDPYAAMDGISVVTLSATDRLDQDFGYQPHGVGQISEVVWYDSNGDGARFGFMEIGISNVAVSLYADLDGNDSYSHVRTVLTDAAGAYLFESLPAGAYRVVVDADSAALPRDAFDNGCRPTTAVSADLEISAAAPQSGAAFGFVLPGAVGDTVYWDYNGNGDQDWTEPGISNVTVKFYRDANADGLLDAGDVLADTVLTDASGKYIFEGLLPGRYVVEVVTNAALFAGAVLTADPDNDGDPCPVPAVAGPSCDARCGVLVVEESTFRGADFGFLPPGVLGDLLWIDLNGNGARDVGELGIPHVTVELYRGGTLVGSCVSDADGAFSFGNLSDGTYRVQVLTSDPDFPSQLTACFDADGTPDSVTDGIVISGGRVTAIAGQPVPDASLEIDFGYRYAGGNRVGGTIGLDASPFDGLLNGAARSGVGSGEYPFVGMAVILRLWEDDGDGVPEAGEAVQIASTFTDAQGDYQFENLPGGTAGARYIVAISVPVTEVKLTTRAEQTYALSLSASTNLLGHTLAAYQVFSVAADIGNVDFAFESIALRDFGDLPSTYSTTVADLPAGPSHTVVAGQNLWLGSGVTAELNGQPSATASGDAGDDGVAALGLWRDGAAGGTVRVKVGAGDGWLAGWIDFNQDGAFTNANERVIAQPVFSATNSGVYDLSFDIPAGTFRRDGATVLNARFRLYAEKPLLPTFSGLAAGGEVEDHQFAFGIIGNFVWEDLDGNGRQGAGEPGVSNLTVQLYGTNGVQLSETVTGANGYYAFTGLPRDAYRVRFSSAAGSRFTPPPAQSLAGFGDSFEPVDDSDSDAAADGSSGIISLDAALDRRDIDAGLFVPATIEGNLFVDRNGDLLRNAGDASLTNVLVQLSVNGTVVAATNSGSHGYYRFENVAPGAVTLLVSSVSATLLGVPATTDPARNRALPSGSHAYIPVALVSGYGVLADRPGETLNFGFADYPLSTALDLDVYASGGGVMIDVWTVNEAGYEDIVIYAWVGNAWTEVGRVPSWQIVGEGSNRYTVQASGLAVDGAYFFKVVDEAGHVHYSDGPVAVHAIRVAAVRLDMQTLVLTFNTEKGRMYRVKASTDLVNWATEYASFPTARGWSAYSAEPFTAGGASIQIRVPVNGRRQAFFKVVRADE